MKKHLIKLIIMSGIVIFLSFCNRNTNITADHIQGEWVVQSIQDTKLAITTEVSKENKDSLLSKIPVIELFSKLHDHMGDGNNSKKHKRKLIIEIKEAEILMKEEENLLDKQRFSVIGKENEETLNVLCGDDKGKLFIERGGQSIKLEFPERTIYLTRKEN